MICSAEDNLTKILFDQATYRGNDPTRLGILNGLRIYTRKVENVKNLDYNILANPTVKI